MSFYNMMNGYTSLVVFGVPLIGEGHHPDEFPRFRDCFSGDDEHPEYRGKIIIYTRTGGNNRDHYKIENNWIRALPCFIADYDDSFDNTFAWWVFDVPEEFKKDWELVLANKVKEVSEKYQDRVIKVFPKLADSLREMWGKV